MKVLITGGNGALGKSLIKEFPDCFSPSRSEMDVTSAEKVKKVILGYEPEIIIHTAAYVDVRGCEENKEKAWNTNVEGTQNIVDALKKLDNDCYLVYISTACVFAGENKKFYTEEDVPSPKNFYALTKLCGEIVTRQYDNTVIIRTNFAPRERWKYPKAFIDRFGTYLFSDDVAKGIREVVADRKRGVIHIVGDKRLSMFDLAKLAGSDVGEMTLADYHGPPVTVDMSLGTVKWKKYKI